MSRRTRWLPTTCTAVKWLAHHAAQGVSKPVAPPLRSSHHDGSAAHDSDQVVRAPNDQGHHPRTRLTVVSLSLPAAITTPRIRRATIAPCSIFLRGPFTSPAPPKLLRGPHRSLAGLGVSPRCPVVLVAQNPAHIVLKVKAEHFGLQNGIIAGAITEIRAD